MSPRLGSGPSLPTVAVVLLALLPACADDGQDTDAAHDAPGLSAMERLQLRERAAGFAEEQLWDEVHAALAPAIAAPDATTDDLLHGAIAEFERLMKNPLLDRQPVDELLARVLEREPDHEGALWIEAQIARNIDLDSARALTLAQRVHSRKPWDAYVKLLLANCLDDVGRSDEALDIFRQAYELCDRETEPGLWSTSAHQYGLSLRRSGDIDAAYELLRLAAEIPKALKLDSMALQRGAYTRVPWPEHEPASPRASVARPTRWEPRALIDMPWRKELAVEDVDGDGRQDVIGWALDDGVSVARQTSAGHFEVSNLPVAGLAAVAIVDTDLSVGSGSTLRREPASRPPEVVTLSLRRPAGVDEQAPTVDVRGTPVQIIRREHAGVGWLHLVGDFGAFTPGDFDHDGDVDLALTLGPPGAALLDNRGANTWADATPEALAALGAVAALHAEDLDGDNDLDLVVHGPRIHLLSNLRRGAFADVSAALPGELLAEALDLADADGDGHPDLAVDDGEAITWYAFRPDPVDPDDEPPALAGHYVAAERMPHPDNAGRWELRDVDLDGRVDLVAAGQIVHGPLLRRDGPAATSSWPATGAWHVADVLGADEIAPFVTTPAESTDLRDSPLPLGDGRWDLLLPGEHGVEILAGDTPSNSLALDLRGLKDGARARGVVLEVRAGDTYQRQFLDGGGRFVVGLGDAPQADVLRLRWPNGVAQHVFDTPAGSRLRILQINRDGDSCPFLWTHDGERWHFVTDALGTTPLGLPFHEGADVPFDHEEYVKVSGELLRPGADGWLRVAVTEELREVTYLDEVRLQAVDHPADVEVQPNEGFVFPPFPAHELHALPVRLAPTRALTGLAGHGPDGFGSVDVRAPDDAVLAPLVDTTPSCPSAGTHPRQFGEPCPPSAAPSPLHADASRIAGDHFDPRRLPDTLPALDVAPWVAELDGRCPRPFRLAPPQFEGLVEPWSLDLHFGADATERAAIREATRLRLLLTGWIEWGDASVNLAAAEHPDFTFDPPTLWVPDGDGWRRSGPPVGFPAGKTRTLVVDVTELLDRDDPRLRLTTSLELSWDRIALAVGDSADVRVTDLSPQAAALDFRGVSAPLCTGRDDVPELYDWDTRVDVAPWNPHPGRYTRYGDVLPLLDATDDTFAILAAGDAVEVRFDARDLPDLPDGWTRDWFVYLDGWAKDGDPNTHAAERVTPLPFHGMSSYPPPADEAAPVEARRAEWNATWNTRAPRALMPDLRVWDGR